MRALGAKLVPVPYGVAWKALGERSFPGVHGTFVHPFDDHHFIAGHATMALEILEVAPDASCIIAAIARMCSDRGCKNAGSSRTVSPPSDKKVIC